LALLALLEEIVEHVLQIREFARAGVLVHLVVVFEGLIVLFILRSTRRELLLHRFVHVVEIVMLLLILEVVLLLRYAHRVLLAHHRCRGKWHLVEAAVSRELLLLLLLLLEHLGEIIIEILHLVQRVVLLELRLLEI